MKKLILLLLYFWVLLIENGTKWLGILYDFGNGLEIRLSLILKILFLFLNIYLLLIKKQKSREINFVLYFMLFLLASTFYVGIINPQYFLKAIAVNFHIQLVLNIIIYIYWTNLKEPEIKKFYNYLRFFGLFNAILVIISFFFPTLTSFFEAKTSSEGITRAFGLMGDEVSMILTFFFFDALIFKQKIKTLIFAFALFCTGGIGAFFTFIVLIGYYTLFVIKISKKNITKISVIAIFILIGIFIFSSKIKEINVIKRVTNNIENPETGSANLRLISLSTAYEMFKERPILGSGYGAYGPSVRNKFENLTYINNIPITILSSAFNPYMQMICEAGVIGLFFFILLLRRLLKVCKRKVDTKNNFISNFKTVTYGWLLIFFLTCLTANWFLPASYNFLLVVTLVGLNLKLNSLQNEESVS
jgi:hypothetical protein